MVDKKLRFALMTYFTKKSKARGINEQINQFAGQWAADALIESYGYDTIISAIDFHFKVSPRPNWTWFTYNADKVVAAQQEYELDQVNRLVAREKAKEWLT